MDVLLAENNFQKFFVAGGWLVWIVLLPMSALAVQLVVQNSLLLRRRKLLPEEEIDQVRQKINNGNAEAALSYVDKKESLLARTLQAGLSQYSAGREAMENVMVKTIEEQSSGLMRKIEWLNVVGNVAPMIGLFGTVWGMIDAFNGIVEAGGQPEPVDLADGISIALVTTWWGLIVAIPALAAYGFFRNRIDTFAAETAVTAEHILKDMKATESGTTKT